MDPNATTSGIDTVDSIEEVQNTALQTLSEMILSFVEHLPYLFGGLLTILLTWGLARLVTAFGTRLLSHWGKRESVKELIVRLASIVIWVFGLLLSAIILFPGLTPAKALGGLQGYFRKFLRRHSHSLAFSLRARGFHRVRGAGWQGRTRHGSHELHQGD